VHEPCNDPSEEFDPNAAGSCIPAAFRLISPTFDPGVTQVFDFGWHANYHSYWTIEGFSHSDMPGFPEEFELHRTDYDDPNGCSCPRFDAVIIPCPANPDQCAAN
jgi:hypothetical protein